MSPLDLRRGGYLHSLQCPLKRTSVTSPTLRRLRFSADGMSMARLGRQVALPQSTLCDCGLRRDVHLVCLD